jgi:hypothetical protein
MQEETDGVNQHRSDQAAAQFRYEVRPEAALHLVYNHQQQAPAPSL